MCATERSNQLMEQEIPVMRQICSILCALAVNFLALVPTGSLLAQTADRLPESAVPLHYRLDLTIVPDASEFSGSVEIDVMLLNGSDTIVLHGEGLTVDEATIVAPDAAPVRVTYSESPESGMAQLKAPSAVGPGKITLKLIYRGPISNSLLGLYSSRYDGRTYAYTQMEAIYARRVFPSFDEPRFKTPFDIAITHKSDQIAISNGPEMETKAVDDGFTRTQFATTQKLPTYLIALAVGEFDIVEWPALPPTGLRDREIPLRGIVPKGEGEKVKHALTITRPIFEILENWFQIPYSYAKLDLIAAHDFRSWGMENAGAIIYRADKLLLDDPPSVYARRTLASLHAHELAHSWFGNYVTPLWWDDIWLNESFATWMANKVLHLWKPEEYPDHRAIESASWAVWNDRLANARAVRQPIKTDGDIVNAFDSTSYSKGGGVLSMVERFLGPEKFQKAVQSYVRAHPHGNASTGDFLDALSKSASDNRLSAAIQTFLDQPGIPRVEAQLQCKTTGGTGVRLEQSRFLPLGSTGNPKVEWQIPICVAHAGGDSDREQRCQLITQQTETIPLPTGRCPDWVLPNSGGAAYVVYDLDEDGWEALIENFDKLTIAEQISTASSVNAAFLAGRIDTTRLIQFAKLLAGSADWDVSRTPMNMLRTLKYRIAPVHLRAKVGEVARQSYADMRSRFETDTASFGAIDPDPVKAKQRSDLFWFLALDSGDMELHNNLAEAGRKFTGFGSAEGMNRDLLHPNFRWSGLIAALEAEGLPFAEHLIGLLNGGFDRTLHNSLLAALGHSVDPEVVTRVRELIVDPKTHQGDASFLLGRQAGRGDNAAGMLDWMTQNYDRLLKILPTSEHPWLVWRTSGSCSAEARDRIETFFRPRIEKLTGAKRSLTNVLEEVALCAALRKAQRPGAVKAFTQ